MLKNKLKIITILIIGLFSLSGCSSNSNVTTNIENFYYVVAVGIDKGEEAELKLSVQIATSKDSESSSSDSSQSTSSIIDSVECSTIDSGISILDNFLSKKLNFSHCSALIFSEEISREGIAKYINTFTNNPEMRPTCNVLICNTETTKALEAVSNSDESFSTKLYEFLINSVNYTGYSIKPEITDFYYNLNSDFPTPIASYISVKNEILQNDGIALFENDKFVGKLGVLDSIAYSLITDTLKSCTISINDPFHDKEKLDISISAKKKPKINAYFVNNSPYIEADIFLSCSIKSATNEYNYESASNVKIIEEAINSYLEEITLNFLYTISHQYNLDICNFKNFVSSKYLTFKELNKTNWNEVYKNSFFQVKVHSSLDHNNLLTQE